MLSFLAAMLASVMVLVVATLVVWLMCNFRRLCRKRMTATQSPTPRGVT